MYLVASSYFFIFLAPYIYTPFIDKEVGAYFSLAFLNLIIIVFIISIFLNPEIIRSPSYFIQKKQYNIEINKKIIDPDKIKEIEKALQITIIHKKQYLQKKYSLPRLSEETKIPIHHLSAYLNQYLHITFNDFINKYRVEYIKQILNNKSYHQHLRLESLAEDAGFGNRTTFISAFKKFTGVTPSEYIKINHDEPDAKKNN
jgi:AraC-like DNA-binding protein